MTGSDLAILIPVLGRPERVEPVLESALDQTPDALVLFLASPRDVPEQDALLAAGALFLVCPWEPAGGDYARKINLGFKCVTDRVRTPPDAHGEAWVGSREWVFLGADDLVFGRNWYQACRRQAKATRACVIGTNDLGNSRTATGQHSTHTLVNRGYWDCGTADEAGAILHEGYQHEYVDDELVHTARWRRTYAHAPDAVVEHLHPDWGKGQEDATYRKARAGRGPDNRLFHERQRMYWGGPR